MSNNRSHTKQGRETARRRASDSANIVILAGGKGTRLAPYTSILPKPLMPIGDRSILEIVINQLAAQRFKNVTLCVGHLSHLIRSVLDHQVGEDIALRYVQEEKALGTAGPLRLIEGTDGTFVVMNGDVLTTLDFRALVQRHRQSGDALTIATCKRTTTMDYGVIHLDGPSPHPDVRRVVSYDEKPELASIVSMGIYVLEPRAVEYVPEGEYFDFPDLVQALLRAGEPVGSYLYDGLWFDIGRQEDYELAVQAWSNQSTGKNGAGGASSKSRTARGPGSRHVH
jgi:NDP-sugar pyrophosphorylase family protein